MDINIKCCYFHHITDFLRSTALNRMTDSYNIIFNSFFQKSHNDYYLLSEEIMSFNFIRKCDGLKSNSSFTLLMFISGKDCSIASGA